ncbi:hypothetical protein SDC9_147105 [bioreactor metagenome]|uniref:Uncharacterized protein n=1 Tax=bioreactor metagenome TaxID=1076179 RepID=A0A645EDG5_9ZZZZ
MAGSAELFLYQLWIAVFKLHFHRPVKGLEIVHMAHPVILHEQVNTGSWRYQTIHQLFEGGPVKFLKLLFVDKAAHVQRDHHPVIRRQAVRVWNPFPQHQRYQRVAGLHNLVRVPAHIL